jgi:hypothetical protein
MMVESFSTICYLLLKAYPKTCFTARARANESQARRAKQPYPLRYCGTPHAVLFLGVEPDSCVPHSRSRLEYRRRHEGRLAGRFFEATGQSMESALRIAYLYGKGPGRNGRVGGR